MYIQKNNKEINDQVKLIKVFYFDISKANYKL